MIEFILGIRTPLSTTSMPLSASHLPGWERWTGGSQTQRVSRTEDVMDTAAKLAVLIDADNAQPSAIEALLAEVAKYGTAHVKRAYGDWTGTGLRGWKELLLSQSIQPIQQFAYTTGKNATDSALIIDAMDLLYSGRFDGFCIVSSDSDFTRLASRLRESGLTVYGFGERKTPKPFVAACDKFVYTENLNYTGDPSPGDITPTRATPTIAPPKNDTALVALLRNAVEAASDDDGWASLSSVGNIILKQRPDFDPRSYGYGKLSDLVTATTLFDTERRNPGGGKPGVIYVRDKRQSSARTPKSRAASAADSAPLSTTAG
ncbi:NYN domain-containing protein [Micromonospora sp. NBC_01813]|uniref:NYN domain-containing protein n=1 Tax=Micromonospora sp. NBC_01813 TaxID=2975988 RepID=UPI002DDAACDD|nr:NYN domain-containing protein [Micromonospora sp. NBC_01813]WSA07062.1 NYN domain-containing protein [Micromonospora sp. NBC_01813]